MLGIFGCKKHHYGEKEKTCRIKTIPHASKHKVTMVRMIKQECLHEGCSKTKKNWEQVKTMKKNNARKIINNPEKLSEVGIEPIFEGVKQEKRYMSPGDVLDLNDYVAANLKIKVVE